MDWRKRRETIKQYILEMYQGTTEQNRKELYALLEFVISNYDLDDTLYTQMEDDLDLLNRELNVDGECLNVRDLENEEYHHNIIEPQLKDFNGGC